MVRPPRRFGLRTRLLALVLAPAVVLSAVGGVVAARERRTTLALREVRDQVRVLSHLTDLRIALLGARAPVEVEVRAATIGIDRAAAMDLLGITTKRLGDLGDVSAELGRIPRAARPFSAARVRSLATAIDRGPTMEVLDRFDVLDLLAQQRWNGRLSALREQVVATGSARLAARLDDLDNATEAGSAAATMVTKLADHWFATFSGSPRAARARSALAAAAQQFDRSMALLQTSADPVVARAARRIAAQKPGTPFDAAVDDAVAGRPPAPFAHGIDASAIGRTFSSSFDLFLPLLDVMSRRAASLAASASGLAREAQRTSMLVLVGVLLAIALMVGGSFLVAASVERPLARLIAGTRRVGEGDLAVEPIPTDGPAEIGEASAAFNDVVANLRLLEGKVDALSHADFEDPRLAQPLPGPLGDAMAERIEVLSDSIRDRTRLQDELAYEASHDALTGIHNRAAAIEALEAAMARARRHRTPLAVAFLDLDGFKQVNDAHGHQAGDDVLRETARRITDVARAGDSCARFGGDEFVIVAEQIDGEAGGMALGRRVADAIDRPISLGTFTVQVGASIGIALMDPTDRTALELLARADMAAYHAKRQGSSVEPFTEDLRPAHH